MTDRTSEVPLDLQNAMRNAEDGGSGHWMDHHPPTDWYDCPNCGTRLSGQSLFHATDDVLAVTYSCTNDDCRSLWVWERASDELYYRGEVEVGNLFEPDTDED